MPRWLLTAAVLTLAVSFSNGSATAGLFSHGHDADCAVPTCAAPLDNCVMAPSCEAPSCYAPADCAPIVGPSCAIPCENYVEVGCCETQECERECCLKRGFRKLMDLERRKNNCLKDTLLGWRDKGHCHGDECAPVYYYDADCAVPGCAVPECAVPGCAVPGCAAPY